MNTNVNIDLLIAINTVAGASAKGFVQSDKGTDESISVSGPSKSKALLGSVNNSVTADKIQSNDRVQPSDQTSTSFKKSLNKAKAKQSICASDKASPSSQGLSALANLCMVIDPTNSILPKIMAHKQGQVDSPSALLSSLGIEKNQAIDSEAKILFESESSNLSTKNIQPVLCEKLVQLTPSSSLICQQLRDSLQTGTKSLHDKLHFISQYLLTKYRVNQEINEETKSKPVQNSDQGIVKSTQGRDVLINLILSTALNMEKTKENGLHKAQEIPSTRSELLIASNTSSKSNKASETDKHVLTDVLSKRAENSNAKPDNLQQVSFSRTLTTNQLSISAEQTENQKVFVNNGSSIILESAPSSENSQLKIFQTPFGSPQPNQVSNNTLPNEAAKSVAEQILESIHASVRPINTQIIIRLNPPELGSVCIKFEQQQDEITGLLNVSKAETRYEIEQSLPQIIRSLADSGIQLRRLDVQLEDSLHRQPDREQFFQEGSYQQPNFAQEDNSNRQTPADLFIDNDNPQDNPQFQRGLYNGRIDMFA